MTIASPNLQAPSGARVRVASLYMVCTGIQEYALVGCFMLLDPSKGSWANKRCRDADGQVLMRLIVTASDKGAMTAIHTEQ